jgi:DNA damage-inducible protein 1
LLSSLFHTCQIDLCISKEHLQKELNYYNPRLAAKLRGKDRVAMVQVWREELVKGGIQGALQASSKLLKERQMQDRRLTNPSDPEVVEYYASIERKKKVQQQYEQMMQEYPEALGRVLMLYIGCKINGHDIQAFCDSGAQSTIMSKKKATECELIDYVDTRFEGTAVGVGTGKILGRIHIVQLQVGSYFFPCSITVMDDPPPGAAEMPFLLGLDMMKRHQCVVDLGKGVLKWKLDDDYLEAPFLHEKDLDESQGGTKGFDASAANQKVMEMHEKEDGEDMSD